MSPSSFAVELNFLNEQQLNNEIAFFKYYLPHFSLSLTLVFVLFNAFKNNNIYICIFLMNKVLRMLSHTCGQQVELNKVDAQPSFAGEKEHRFALRQYMLRVELSFFVCLTVKLFNVL